MSKYKYFLFSLVTFAVFTSSVSAVTCSYEERAELNSEVAHIEASYEEIQIELAPDEYSPPDVILGTEYEETFVQKVNALQINILNLTEKVYVEVTNEETGETTTYNFSDTNNGNLAIIREDISQVARYEIEVYSSSATDCEGNLLRTLRLNLPRYNEYSTYPICNQMEDYYLCQRYVTFDEMSYGDFFDRIYEEDARRHNESENDQEDNPWYEAFWDKYKTPIIVGGISLIVIGGGVAVVIVIRRRRRII